MIAAGTYRGVLLDMVVNGLMDGPPRKVTIHCGPELNGGLYSGVTVPRGPKPTDSHQMESGSLKLFLELRGQQGRWPFFYHGGAIRSAKTIQSIVVH